MLYMVELDFTAPTRQSAWDAWYGEHLRILLAVPGIHTAQRFVCTTRHSAPYLAVYTVEAPEVFESGPYRARGGRDSTGEWKVTMVNWDRNLFSGIDRAPAVAEDEILLVTESAQAAAAQPEIAFAWLDAVGLDRTVARRAIAVAAASRAHDVRLAGDGRIRAYRSLMSQRTAGSA